MKNKKNVILADFLYNLDRGPSYYLAPLNVGYIAAYAKSVFGEKLNFNLYRNVDKFIEDFKKDPPGVIGFSQYIWNQDLTQNILKWVKTLYPETVVVFGGAMLGANKTDSNTFIKNNPLTDFYVPLYGEHGFTEVLKRYLECNGNIKAMKESPIEGASFVRDRAEIIHSPVSQLKLKPNEIPSPYLTGFMDSFLKEGYSPIIQCMRGCPYTCSYCFASKLKIYKFPIERVMNEIDYIYKRTKSPALAITDDNFGIFERDVEIAKYIRSYYDKFGYPNKLLLYYAKKSTKTVTKIAKTVKELTPFFVSYQSRNPDTLKAIKRYNTDNKDVHDIVAMCKENKISVASEMIFGLPEETKESFINGIRELYELNVDTIAVYNCKFFNGTDLARKDSREKYKIKTRHRLYEDNFGIFKTNDSYKEILACETDEIPVETSSYNFKDFMDIRRLGFWIELCFAKKIYYEALKHLENYGISPVSFISEIISGKYEMPEAVAKLFSDIEHEFSGELFKTHEELKKFAKEKLSQNPKFKSKKINLFYIYKPLYTELARDFDLLIKNALYKKGKEVLDAGTLEDFIEPLDELFSYHRQRIVNPENPNKKEKDEYSYDFIKWEKEMYKNPLLSYAVKDKIKIEFTAKIPGQFEILTKTIKSDMRPFTWHNYIYSSNIKAECEYSDQLKACSV